LEFSSTDSVPGGESHSKMAAHGNDLALHVTFAAISVFSATSRALRVLTGS
jgi:hypothetical protein